MRALSSSDTRDRCEETAVRRTIIGFIFTFALGYLFATPLAAEAQPPAKIPRLGVLSS
jgi:hypothetical protein